MTKNGIIDSYREWRKANGNKMPNRVIVRIMWEDTKEEEINTISLRKYRDGNVRDEMADVWIFFYANVSELYGLTKPNNGNDFHITKICEWYKS